MNNDQTSRPVRLGHRPLALIAAPETGGMRYRGALVGSLSAGFRRTPARASAARPDAPPSPGVHPGVGTGTLGPHAMRADAALPRAAARQGGPQLAATAQCSGPRAAAVDHLVGAS